MWVNGDPVKDRRLVSGDTIELGHDGPLSRFRYLRDDAAAGYTVSGILGDAVAYLRTSRKPYTVRLVLVGMTMIQRLVRETTLLFRGSVLVALVVLAAVLYRQHLTGSDLEAALAASTERLERVAIALARAQRTALSVADLEHMSDNIDSQLAANIRRLEVLEQHSSATARVIADASTSVGFIQTAYGFRDRNSGRFLRHTLDDEGNRLFNRAGAPVLTLGGNGGITEVQVTGTGFLVAGQKAMLTNRHVVMPWENNANADIMALQGLDPAERRTIAYFPDCIRPVELKRLVVSDTADLAILVPIGPGWPEGGLVLADGGPDIGSAVIVMGFPTGLRAMLAQSGPAFIKALGRTAETDFWLIARRLAEHARIAPLSSHGIVGQVSDSAVIYDAETTHGGSGGPVMDYAGRVVAVNSAILPEYGGSNIGVPAHHARALLRAAGLGP